MPKPVDNVLRRERSRRGLSQEEMAALAKISRQSYAAIESGTSVPSTLVALRLARALGRPVERLFRLVDQVDVVSVEPLGGPPDVGAPVRLAEIAGRRVAIPVRRCAPGAFLPADGIVVSTDDGRVGVRLFSERPPRCELVTIGCDPAAALVGEALRDAGLEAVSVSAGSRAALEALARGQAHVAGIHLLDPASGSYNDTWVRRLVPFPCVRVRFAHWEQSLMVAAGNPHALRDVADLAGRDLRFLNREAGSGTRSLLDAHLERAGVPGSSISGYDRAVPGGHVAVAQGVASGLADAGLGVRAAALALGLEAIPMAEEPYDLVIPRHCLDLPSVHTLLDVLRSHRLRTQVEALGGYDVSAMGTEVGSSG